MRFSKMHGAGNDFVVLDLRDGAVPPTPTQCRRLADRHFGVGCDQILTIEAARDAGAIAAYRIWNADGSVAKQCGNGARCVAAWVRRDGEARGTPLPARFDVDSPTGRHAVECFDGGQVRLDMGRPAFAPVAIPLEGFDEAAEYRVEVAGRELRFGAVSMGNPHAVVEVDDLDMYPVATVGAALQRHPAFPDSVNVGFARVLDRGRIRLRVFERGVGETHACGSGACAAAAHFMRRGRVDREVTVSLLGGDLRIDWPSDEASLGMLGPTTFVFEGDWLDDRRD
ncbi:diaminopimelate epimerase [Lysobacter humi (ex Lee et al. 2017)]